MLILFANKKKESEVDKHKKKRKEKCYMCEFNKCFMYKVNCLFVCLI